MHTQSVLRIVAMSILIAATAAFTQDGEHSFALGERDFLLDGRPIILWAVTAAAQCADDMLWAAC